MDRVSFCNIYAIQQDTQYLMINFMNKINHQILCILLDCIMGSNLPSCSSKPQATHLKNREQKYQYCVTVELEIQI